MIVISKAASDSRDTLSPRSCDADPSIVSAHELQRLNQFATAEHQHSAEDLATAVQALSDFEQPMTATYPPYPQATTTAEREAPPGLSLTVDADLLVTAAPSASPSGLLVPPGSAAHRTRSTTTATCSEEDSHHSSNSGGGGRSPSSSRRHKKSGSTGKHKEKRKSSSMRSKRPGFLSIESAAQDGGRVGGSMKETRPSKRSPLIPRSASHQESGVLTPKTVRAPRHSELADDFAESPAAEEGAGYGRERSESINQTGRLDPVYATVRRKGPKGTAKQVEDYQLGEKLGKGAFGAVYKGLNVRSGQFVAVKRLRRQNLDEDALMTEVNTLKNLNHPNIVRYIGLLKTTNHLNMILEYVEGGSLSQVLSSYGFFPESLAAIYLEQVLIGLRYLHSQSVIHRDIKGGNLLITKNGRVKVADFGIALVAQSEKDSGARDFAKGDDGNFTLVAGSPFWMAPEVIEMNVPTAACDIWSVGCTLIELLTGFPPYFDMVALSAVFKMVQDEHPPLPDDISPELESFLLRCFARDPTQRPSAHDLLADPWIRKFSRRDADEVLTLPAVTDVTSTAAADNTAGDGASAAADAEGEAADAATVPLDEMTGTIKEYNTLREKEYTEKRALSAIDWDQPADQRKSTAAEERSSSPESSPTKSSTSSPHTSPSTASGSVLLESDVAAVDAATTSMRQSAAAPKPKPAAGDPMSMDEESPSVNSSGRSIVGSLRRKKKKERDQIPQSMHGGSVRGKKTTRRKKFNFKDLKDQFEDIAHQHDFVILFTGVETKRNLLFQYTLYRMKVCNAKETWVIYRTWNDFRDLHAKLEKQLPSIKLPRLPPSKFFGVMDPAFVKQRKSDLEKYSARLAAIPSVCRSELFQFFLRPIEEEVVEEG